jgi:formylglycine-generating enzyme required for sulfatase activity
MNRILLLSLLALGYQTASAASLLETFGTGTPNVFTMEFVTIGNPNNAADTTGAPNPAGSVAYTYNLGKYEVSRDQITKANVAGSLGITMAEMGSYGGNGLLKPATGISWYEAAKYVNYLNTSTGNTAAYKFVSGTFQLWSAGDAGYNANNMFRNSLAKYVIASSNEWYKGAYGKADGSWLNFPNGTDSAPTAVTSGTAANTAVYGQSFFTGPADITSAGGLSPYGTMGQGGNVWERMETAYDGTNNTAGENRELRGGSWDRSSNILDASNRDSLIPTNEDYNIGFRVASVPEPATGLLVVLGLSGLLLKRRKTGTL